MIRDKIVQTSFFFTGNATVFATDFFNAHQQILWIILTGIVGFLVAAWNEIGTEAKRYSFHQIIMGIFTIAFLSFLLALICKAQDINSSYAVAAGGAFGFFSKDVIPLIIPYAKRRLGVEELPSQPEYEEQPPEN